MANFIDESGSWLLLNLDKHEYIVLGGSTESEVTRAMTPLSQWLDRPLPPPFVQAISKSSVYPVAKYTAAQGKRTGVLHLPTELLHTIARNLIPSEAVCLALTCRLLCAVVGPQVGKLQAPWAGNRLVRVNGSVLLTDFASSNEDRRSESNMKLEKTAKTRQPMDMLTDLERREILTYNSAISENVAWGHSKRTVYAFVKAYYRERDSFGGMPFDLVNLPHRLAKEPASEARRRDILHYEEWCKTWRASFSRLLCPGITNNKDVPSAALALRNLSTRQFVYERDIVRYRAERNIDQYDLDLEHIVLRQVLWHGGKGKGEAVTTSWAGNRFEISPMGEGEEGWMNVSEEVVDSLRREQRR